MKTHYTVVKGGEPFPVVVDSPDECRFVAKVQDESGAISQSLELEVTPISKHEYLLRCGDEVHDVLVDVGPARAVVHFRGRAVEVTLLDEQQLVRRALGGGAVGAGDHGDVPILASMPGRVVKCLVAEGETIQSGQGVIVVEAMKMENELSSPATGKVKQILVGEGDAVEAGHALVLIDAE